jgi:putative salt-induced outer membrane protein YdiY
VLTLFVCAAVSAFADQVTLKNGDRLTGAIVKSDGKTLVLHTDYADDVIIHFTVIQSIESTAPLHLHFQDGRTAVGTVSTSDSTLRIRTETGETAQASISGVVTVRNEAEELAYEKSLHPGPLEEWKAGLNVGFALTRGNSQTKNVAIAFTAARETLHDKLGAYANSVYASNDVAGAVPSTTANAAGGGFRYDHDLNRRIFAFVAADFFADALQGLNIRSVLGGGLGYHVVKTDRTTLDLLGGANYTHESYTTMTRNLAALTLGEELMHKIGKGTVLNEQAKFFPDLSNTGEYRSTLDIGTVTKLNRWLGWQNALADIYVTDPPAGKKKNDLILTTGLHISLGQ